MNPVSCRLWRVPLTLLIGLLSVGAGTLLVSCRTPAPELQKKKNLGIVFDTAYRPKPGVQHALLKPLDEAYTRYHKTLAEPVAVTEWGAGKSRWQIFFATNRGIDPATEIGETSLLRLNSNVTDTVTIGRAELRMPSRTRGQDPQLASSPKLLPLPFGKPAAGPDQYAELLQVESLPPAEFFHELNRQVAASTGRDLLLFVHGFNVSFDAAAIRTAQLGLDLPFNGGLCCFSWPSQGGIHKYGKDEIANAESVLPFQRFLQGLILQAEPGTRIQIVVHSMGNRIVMQALEALSRQPGPTQPIDNVVLCAPDVGLADYQKWIGGVTKMARRVTLYAGDSDTALQASKALHAEQRVGDALPPVIAAGVETIDCSPVEMSLMGHSYYGGNIEVLGDLFSLIKEDLSAVNRPWLKQETHAGQTYWKFHSQPTPVYYTWNFPPEKQTPPVIEQAGGSEATSR